MSDTLSSVSPRDARALAQIDALLLREGIRRDRHLDYICALFDEDGQAVATGSCFGNTLRCLAVSSERQGEGLLNRIVSHLMELQAQRGNTHVFLYTKVKSARFFGDLGFYEIARAPGEAVFMENRRTGFADYCRALAQTRREGVCGAVVMNANPFTLGHRYLVEQAARACDAVHLFVLSENIGPIPFAVRRDLVRRGVEDLPNVICHDSGPYIISAATFPSYFLPDDDSAAAAHARLDLAVFGRIAEALGVTRRYVGQESASHVTAIYNETMAKSLPELGIECIVVPRLELAGRVVSASTVRQAIHDGVEDTVQDMLPPATAAYFASPEAEGVIRAIRAMSDARHH